MTSSPTANPSRKPRRPLYRQMVDALRKRIEDGALEPGKPAPSESDLIAEFRVSSTTARRCLNELAQAGLVRRVQGKGTFVAENVSLTACRHIGLLFHDLIDLTDTFSAALLRGVRKTIDGHNVEPVLMDMSPIRRSRDPREGLQMLLERHRVDALLMMSPAPPAWLEPVLDAGMPVAAVNFAYSDKRIASITGDVRKAYRRLAKRMLKLGHDRVVVLKGFFEKQQVEGVTMSEFPLELPEAPNWNIERFRYFQPGAIREIVDRHLAAKQRPTGFLCFGYEAALEAAHLVRERDWQVPQDLSVVFIGGATNNHSRYTGEIAPIAEMSSIATQWLIDRIEGRQPTQPNHVLQPETKEGDTLAAAAH